MQLLPSAAASGATVGVIPSEFYQDLWHQKTRVTGLSSVLFA